MSARDAGVLLGVPVDRKSLARPLDARRKTAIPPVVSPRAPPLATGKRTCIQGALNARQP
jgi:hypothetical protein